MNRAPERFWDLPSAALLLLVLLSTSEGLYTTQWAPGLGTAILLAEAGAVLGMTLGYSQFKRVAVTWFSFGYSLPIVILVLGWILYGGNSWMERLADLSARLNHSLGLFFTSQPVQDTLLFVVFMALVFWIIGLVAGFALTRFGNFIGAVVPAGAILVTVQLYNAGRGGGNVILAVYLLLGVLELGRMTYAKRRVYWKEQGVALLVESRTDLNFTLVIVACIIVATVWLAPTSAKQLSDIKTAWDNLSRPLQTVQENLGHAVAGLQSPGTVRPVDFYGDNLSLGNQAATGQTELFRIRAPLENGLQRYYWRVRSYNTFLNDQWYSQDATTTYFVPTQVSFPLAVPELLTGEFSFTSLVPNLAVLVTPAGPVWVSHASEVVYLQTPDGKMDPVQFLSQPSILSGQQYLVHANLSEPTILEMRNAGAVYPDWITKNYLQLPKTLSPEIVALAQRITDQARTPYDKADAITQYLRNNITYSTTVNDPPPGQDSLDWFLFDSKTGFCNYYATAEVIILRSVGVPARMVVGFAQGEYSAPNLYVVRELDEHAWPEVYFPGVGWVEFEPTGNQAPLVRPSGETIPSGGLVGTITPPFPGGQNITGRPTPITPGETSTNSGSGTFVKWLLALILLFAILITALRINSFGLFNIIPEGDEQAARNSLPAVVKYLVENQGLASPDWLSRWAYLAGLDPIERSFTTVYTSLRWLGQKAVPAQTPAEAAAALAERLPQVSVEIDSLLHEYQRQLYGQRHGRVHPARSAARIIRQEALRVAIQQRWRRFRGIFRLGRR
jgi:transglutaminase-like putative cysteine protease